MDEREPGIPLDEGVGEGVAGAGEQTGEFAANAFGRLVGIASGGITLVFNLATIAMFTFYFTADAPRVQRAVLRLFTPRHSSGSDGRGTRRSCRPVATSTRA